VEVPAEQLGVTVEDRQTGRRLAFIFRPEFLRSFENVPLPRLEVERRRVAGLADDEVLAVAEVRPARP
jgi:hypothetical protein